MKVNLENSFLLFEQILLLFHPIVFGLEELLYNLKSFPLYIGTWTVSLSLF